MSHSINQNGEQGQKLKEMYRVAKIIMIGDSNVGKTSVVERFSSDTFAPNYIPTIGIDFIVQELIVDDAQYVKLHVWDTAGSEKFDAITRNYYHVANGAMICYDITERSSFDHVEHWLHKLEDNCQQGVPKMLLGNKSDLAQERKVTTEEAQQLAEKNGLAFFECSAKSNLNIYRAFFRMTKTILKTQPADRLKPGMSRPAPKKEEKSKCAC